MPTTEITRNPVQVGVRFIGRRGYLISTTGASLIDLPSVLWD